ncbi:MAG: 30S ribosomal protein S3 [Candidatus Aenigmarchaeota archaeon]|nr:30S ribosomal protein S3 [Candidatus Aenigmarchaeota archaeon]NCS71036.1 30S ribosomal protein S3 [Candidatus Aenigmarchaeota archaeon]OIN86567.1 MAG: 30S ribosomal protein S3 [Candidatus Aenigmarchaeota archaeon CG1_02_38_14]
MAIESFFINEGLREVEIEEFLSKRFEKADYSHIEIQRTPLGTRIIVYVNKPGYVIGRSGRIIKDITDEIREKFNLENPMLDVKEIENPYLDAQVVASRIAKSVERGSFYKKVVNFYLKEIMNAGAVGVQIQIGGKLGGERGRFQKFKMGYIKHAGYYADNVLDRGFAKAVVKLGVIGVRVGIMKDMPEILSKKISDLNDEIKERAEAKAEEKVEAPAEAVEKIEETKKIEEKDESKKKIVKESAKKTEAKKKEAKKPKKTSPKKNVAPKKEPKPKSKIPKTAKAAKAKK